MNSQEYWKKREEAQKKKNIQDTKAYNKEIEKIYNNMMDEIQKEINGFYVRYAKKEGITIAEAKKRASKLDIEEYARKAKKYVAEKDFSDKANEEMRLYNMTMKVNRLELLKAKIGLELAGGFDELEKIFGVKLTEKALKEFERQAGILGKTVLENEKAAHAIVNASFHNATFSERIWMYQGMLKADLDSLLQQGLVRGKNPRELATHLRKRFGVSQRQAETLMITELARVQIEAQKQSFIRNGFSQYEYIACGNTDVCEVCKTLDGKHFKISDMMPGENAPPMHPRCHCSVAAWEDSKEYEEWLNYLEKGGTTEEWETHGKPKRMLIGKNVAKPIEINMNSDTIENIGLMKLSLQFFASKEKQFGKKIGKHARDYGMNPSVKEDREKMKEIIDGIVKGAEQIKIGSWRGYDDEVLFYIKGEDVVITTQEGEFVTILKGGVSNGRVEIARDK